MKIVMFAFLMVVVLMFVESQAGPSGSRRGSGRGPWRGVETDTAARVARNAQTLKNVHERILAETEDAGKPYH